MNLINVLKNVYDKFNHIDIIVNLIFMIDHISL